MDACKNAILPFSIGNTLFEQIWSKENQICQCNLKILFLNQFEYAEFNCGIRFFCFRPETPFLGNFGRKNQYYHFKLKIVT